MKTKNKLLVVLMALVVVVLIGFLITINSGTTGLFSLNKKEYIEVGYISALSGDAGIWGQSLKKGFDFAVEEINSKGGINGKLIKPVFEDDMCDPKTGINAYTKIIEADNVKIITGTVCSSVALSVAPITQENRVLYLASGATHPDVTKQGDLIFRVWVSDAYEARAVTEYAINNLGVNSFGIIYMNDTPSGVSVKDTIEKVVAENNKTITIEEGFLSDTKDFKSIATKVIANNPEAIYIMSTPENMPLIINELKTLNYNGKIFVYGPSILSEGTLAKINDKTNIYYPLPITKQETDFWSNYKQKTGTEADIIVAGGYDSMILIADGLKECGEDNDCIRNYWLSLEDYKTTRGDVSFDKEREITGVEYEIKELN
ncbi:MAG: ABC transporter substrate-binding protein [archaeon]